MIVPQTDGTADLKIKGRRGEQTSTSACIATRLRRAAMSL